MNRPEQLIEELEHNAQVAQNRPMERRLADLTVWYYKNKQLTHHDRDRRLELLERAFWIMLEEQALMIERIHELEGRGKSNFLWTPEGMLVDGKAFR